MHSELDGMYQRTVYDQTRQRESAEEARQALAYASSEAQVAAEVHANMHRVALACEHQRALDEQIVLRYEQGTAELRNSEHQILKSRMLSDEQAQNEAILARTLASEVGQAGSINEHAMKTISELTTKMHHAQGEITRVQATASSQIASMADERQTMMAKIMQYQQQQDQFNERHQFMEKELMTAQQRNQYVLESLGKVQRQYDDTVNQRDVMMSKWSKDMEAFKATMAGEFRAFAAESTRKDEEKTKTIASLQFQLQQAATDREQAKAAAERLQRLLNWQQQDQTRSKQVEGANDDGNESSDQDNLQRRLFHTPPKTSKTETLPPNIVITKTEGKRVAADGGGQGPPPGSSTERPGVDKSPKKEDKQPTKRSTDEGDENGKGDGGDGRKKGSQPVGIPEEDDESNLIHCCYCGTELMNMTDMFAETQSSLCPNCGAYTSLGELPKKANRPCRPCKVSNSVERLCDVTIRGGEATCANKAEYMVNITDKWGPPGARCLIHGKASKDKGSSSAEATLKKEEWVGKDDSELPTGNSDDDSPSDIGDKEHGKIVDYMTTWNDDKKKFERKRVLRKPIQGKKEPDKIDFPKFPKAPQLLHYQVRVATVLVGASCYCDGLEAEFFERAHEEGVTEEELFTVPETFYSLSCKVTAILMGKEYIPAEKVRLRRDIDKMAEDLLKSPTKKTLTARWILFKIYEHFRTEDHMNVVYGILDLMKIKWHGDTPSAMCNFLYIWDRVFEHIPYQLDQRTVRDIFAEQFQTTKVLELDWKAYDLMSAEDPQKTVDFMRKRIEHHVKKQQYRTNRQAQIEALNAHLTGRGGSSKDAMATIPDGKRHGRKDRGRKEKKSRKEKKDKKDKERKDKRERSKSSRRRSGATPKTEKNLAKSNDGAKREEGTRICYFFQSQSRGTCKYGDKCNRSHTQLSEDDFKKTFGKPPEKRAASPASKGKGRGRGHRSGRDGSQSRDSSRTSRRSGSSSRHSSRTSRSSRGSDRSRRSGRSGSSRSGSGRSGSGSSRNSSRSSRGKGHGRENSKGKNVGKTSSGESYCRPYALNGTCKWGADCKFKHWSQSDLRAMGIKHV